MNTQHPLDVIRPSLSTPDNEPGTGSEVNMTTALSDSPLRVLPTEIQSLIAFWVSRRTPGNGRKISSDLLTYRLVCRHFGQLGAQLISTEPHLVKRSSYRGITIDFTVRCLQIVEALVKNPVLARTITNVHIINSRFREVTGAPSLRQITQTYTAEMDRFGFDIEPTVDQFDREQEFFNNLQNLSRLVNAISSFPNLSHAKWLDHFVRKASNPQRRSFAWTDISRRVLDKNPNDEFRNLIKETGYASHMLSNLQTLMGSLTHLHVHAHLWNGVWGIDHGEGNVEQWAELMKSTPNVVCFQLRYDPPNTNLLDLILADVYWPRLRKLYFIGYSTPALSVMRDFLQRHQETLEKIRLPRHDPHAGFMNVLYNVGSWKDTVRKDIEIIGTTMPTSPTSDED